MAELTPVATTAALGAPGAPQADSRAQLQTLAQEFESMLMLQVMRQVRQTVAGLGGDEPDGAIGGDMSSMTDTIDGEVARYLTRAGGFGLSNSLVRSLAPSSPRDAVTTAAAGGTGVTADLSAATVASVAPLDPAAQASGGPTVPSVLDNTVTSSFGWRTDPIAHVRRFHGGVDLRAAYGQEVPAAAEGRVVSAGAQGDYGLSVVIDHGNGFQTRYAHLSSIDVAPGQEVGEGSAIGRAGQSGRATGPHLHLEVLRGGERVDPREWLGTDGFKKTVARAD